ncbi:hypothetical protein quinque_015428 [Culex quinquefasciatus]
MAVYILKACIFLLMVFYGEATVCGVPKINSSLLSSNEEGGTYPGQWPWHVAIYQRPKNQSFLAYKAGGTLISSTFVLTAGACRLSEVDRHYMYPSAHYIRVGIHNLNVLSLGTGQYRSVERFHFPYHWNKMKAVMITLVELRREVQFNDLVQPVCIFYNQVSSRIKSGTVVGWGPTKNDHEAVQISRQLSVHDDDCLKLGDPYNAIRNISLFCVGSPNGTDVCKGDEGNGIFVQIRGVWYVTGMISHIPQAETTDQCRTDGYAGVTKIFSFLKWISSTTNLTGLANETPIVNGTQVDPTQQYQNLLPRQCGSFIWDGVINGQTAPLFAYPWMALLARRDLLSRDAIEYVCDGSLISNRYVLTNSRCTAVKEPPELVRLGEHTMGQDIDCNANDDTDCAPPVRDYPIQFIVTHQNEHMGDSIALVRLNQDVTFEDHIQPICLPVTPELRALQLDQYIVTGWGSSAGTLRQATLEFTTSCDDDAREGSPVGYPVRHRGVRFVQFGVMTGCERGLPVYANVSRLMDWIVVNTDARNTKPAPPKPERVGILCCKQGLNVAENQ